MSLSMLSLTYCIGKKTVLCDVTLTIKGGTIVSVRGPTRAGKTTLGLLAAGLLPVPGLDISTQPSLPRVWGYACGTMTGHVQTTGRACYLPSNPLDTILFPTVRDELSSVLSEAPEQVNEIKRVLSQVGLPPETIDQEIWNLSGGQLQRLALARAVLSKPNLFVADETYEWLDQQGQDILDNILLQAAGAQDEKIVLLLQSDVSPPRSNIANLVSYSLRGGRLTEEAAFASSTFNGWQVSPNLPLQSDGPILEASGIEKAYYLGGTRREVLTGAALVAFPGEWVGIQGANGMGKSVFCRIIAGLEKETRGSLRIDGHDASLKERRGAVGYLFQIPNQQLPFPRLRDVLRVTMSAGIQARARAALLRRGINLESSIRSMTPHQQRMAILCLLLSGGRKLLCIDEPTWGIDAGELEDFLNALRSSSSAGLTVIIVSHSSWLLKRICHRTYQLRNGRLYDDFS